MTTMKWQTTIPTRAQIETHGGDKGVWLVSTPVGSPLGGGAMWPHHVIATFKSESDGIVMYPNRGASKLLPEESLGTAPRGEGRGAWHFAPVVMDDADYTFQPAGAADASGVTDGDGHGYDANTGVTHGTGEEG